MLPNKEQKKQKLRLTIEAILRANNKKIKIDKNILTSLLTIEVEESKISEEEYDKLIQFYIDIIKYADLSEIIWEDIIALSKANIEEILSKALSQASLEYDMDNRLSVSNNTLYMTIFDEWAFLDKTNGIVTHHFVPKFNNIKIEAIDLSNINFNNVIFDVKEFFKKYLTNKSKYEVIFSPDSTLIFQDMGLPIPKDIYDNDEYYENEDYYDDEYDDYDEYDDEYDEDYFDEELEDEDIFENYDEEETIYEVGEYDEEEAKKNDQGLCIIGYTDQLIENGIDYYIDMPNTNANINFKTNEFGMFSDVNFIGTDLSNSHLEECDGIHLEYCNLGATNVKLPKDTSNIIQCSFERSI